MVQLEMDKERSIDINNDPMTEELIFEFKEKNGNQDKTTGLQRIPIRVIANWSKLVYHEIDEKILDCHCPDCRSD